jgi:hypothetical protein
MRETLIFRNIQHIPRIWGVTYLKLFATLGGGLFITTLGFFLTSGATAVVKVAMIVIGVIATLLLYLICFWIDNTDPLERDSASFLKTDLNSQSLSLQRVRFLHHEASDAVSRSGTRDESIRAEARKRAALRRLPPA